MPFNFNVNFVSLLPNPGIHPLLSQSYAKINSFTGWLKFKSATCCGISMVRDPLVCGCKFDVFTV